MSLILKKIIFAITFNSSLFLLLIIGIQNSSIKNKVYLFKKETVNLPISFILGSSFIGGSILGSFFTINLTNKN